MPNASHTIRQEIRGVVVFIGLIWAVFLVSLVFPGLDKYGVIRANSVGSQGSRQCRFCTEILRIF